MSDEQQTIEPQEVEVVAARPPRKLRITRRGWVIVLGLCVLSTVGMVLSTIYWPQAGQPLMTLLGHGEKVYAVAYSPDGSTIASAGDDATVRLWDAVTGAQTGELKHSGPVFGLAYSPDGKLLAAVDSDRTVKLWKMPEGELHATLKHRQQPQIVAFSPDGTHLVMQAVRTGKVTMFDVASGGAQHIDDLQGAILWLVPQTADGKLLARQGDGRQILVSRGFKGEELFKLPGHSDKLNWMVFSPDGRYLASAGGYTFDTYTFRRGEVRLWDMATGELRSASDWQRGAVTGVAFSPDGRRLAASNFDGTVCVWDVESLAGQGP